MATEREPESYVSGDFFATFGKGDLAVWGGPDDPDPVSRAARMQDQVARFVRAHLESTKTSQVAFADLVGIPRPKLNRLIQGREWARLHELERLLGGCGHTLTSVSWAIGDGHRQPEVVQRVIAAYLHEQLVKVGEESARTEQERPSMPGPLH